MSGFSRSVAALVAGTALLLAAAAVKAQPYPSRPIRIVVPFPPGSVSDVVARSVGQAMSVATGQPVTVDNRVGAGGVIGSELVARSAPNGYTLLMGTISTHAINPFFVAKLSYDVDKDFVAVSEVATTPNVVVVGAASAARTMREFVAMAKTRRDVNYATAGVGSGPHLCGELMKGMGGINLVPVHYKGAPEAFTAVLGNDVAMTIQSITSALPLIKGGRLRALAVTSLARSPALPDVPALAEEGFAGYDFTAWSGIFAPAGTPREVVAKLHQEVVKAVKSEEVQRSIAAQGGVVVASTPEQFAEFVRAEGAKWGRVIKAAGIKVE